MPDAKTTIAKAIFSSGAIRFGEFTLASGAKSPYYIDLSRLLTSPKELDSFVRATGGEIQESCRKNNVSALASIELRGALLLSAASTYVNLPCFVIRKSEKTHGVTGRIVGGDIAKGQSFALFDDVITDGQSKLDAIHTLEDAGAHVKMALVVVDREQGGAENLAQQGYPVSSVLTISQLISELHASGEIEDRVNRLVLEYLEHERRPIHTSAG